MTMNIENARVQRGAVLFVALIFMVLITLLGLTTASTSVLQERMTGGLRNGQLAMMGAQSAERGVESLIWNKSNDSTLNKLICGATGGLDHCYEVSNSAGVVDAATGAASNSASVISGTVTNFQRSHTWITTGAAQYGTDMTGLTGSRATASLANQPVYIIEHLGVVLPPGSPPSGSGGSLLPIDSGTSSNQTLHGYRITARSTGANAGSNRVVQSLFVALPPSH